MRLSAGERRAIILEAANDLFAEHGYAEVSIEDIARAAGVTFHDDIAQDSPRLRYALECWTGLNRDATRPWLLGETSREATHEVLTSTLEHVLRRSAGPPTPAELRAAPSAHVACDLVEASADGHGIISCGR